MFKYTILNPARPSPLYDPTSRFKNPPLPPPHHLLVRLSHALNILSFPLHLIILES